MLFIPGRIPRILYHIAKLPSKELDNVHSVVEQIVKFWGSLQPTMPRRRNDIDQCIQAEIAKDSTISEEQLAQIVGVSRNTISDHLNKLIASGAVRPKGYYLRALSRKIVKYVFISQPTDLRLRRKMVKILNSYLNKFPYVIVTEPYDYIVFIPENTPGAETEEFIAQLSDTGATTRTSVLTGEPPEGSPELPERTPHQVSRAGGSRSRSPSTARRSRAPRGM
jgi:DNA-binding Lrp family transcriptional regulator